MGFSCVNLFQTHEMDRDQQLVNPLKLMRLQHLGPLLLVLSGLWKGGTIANAAIWVLNHFLWVEWLIGHVCLGMVQCLKLMGSGS